MREGWPVCQRSEYDRPCQSQIRNSINPTSSNERRSKIRSGRAGSETNPNSRQKLGDAACAVSGVGECASATEVRPAGVVSRLEAISPDDVTRLDCRSG